MCVCVCVCVSSHLTHLPTKQLQLEAAELLVDFVEQGAPDARGRLELAEFMLFFSRVEFVDSAPAAPEGESGMAA